MFLIFFISLANIINRVDINKLDILLKTELLLSFVIFGGSVDDISKGQKKSKWFFQVDVSSKKRTNKFYFTAMKPQVDLFLEEIEDTRKTFRNYLTFSTRYLTWQNT